MNRLASIAVVVLSVAGCGPAGPSWSLGEIEWSGPPGSGEPQLHGTEDGRAILSWLEPAGEVHHALMVAERREGRWSEPRLVTRGNPFFVNWADLPSVTELRDGSWMVHWLEKTAPATYAYHVKLAFSDDGETWSQPVVPHRDRSAREHGFVSAVPWGADGAALVWLDGRNMPHAEGADSELEGRGQMAVYAGTVRSDASVGDEVQLDGRACECCQTALAETANGLLAAYRDRSPDEIRNIAVVRFEGGRWSEPAPVADDGWRYPGCPVNGPQMSAAGRDVVIAWYTAPEQRPRVQVAFSRDAGATFEEPVRVDRGSPLGRVDVERLADGSAVVVWLERGDGEAEILARRVTPQGRLDRAWRVARSSESRASGVPRMALAGDELVFAWTDPGEGGGVRVRAARAASGPESGREAAGR